MKVFLTVAAILFVSIPALQSCKKGYVQALDISGNWNWVATYNDGAPGPTNPLTPANTGNTQSLSFSGNNWVLTRNNISASSGTYSTSPAVNTFGKPVNRIDFLRTNNPVDSVTYYLINSDTLTFSYDLSGTVGFGATIYARK